MGGKSETSQTQQSTTNPWATATPALEGILGQLQKGLGNTGLTGNEQGALGQLQQNAGSASQFAPQIGNYASSLLSGGGANAQAGNVSQNFQDYGAALNGANGAASDNLSGYRTALTGANGAAGQTLTDYNRRLSPTADGSMIGGNNALKTQLDTLTGDITRDVNGSFAAAGRDFSGGNSMALGRGLMQGLAPVLANQYNVDTGNQRGAADALYGAGNTTNAFQAGNAGAGFGAGQSTGQFQAGNAGNLFSGGNTSAGLLSGLNQQGLANQGQGVQAAQDATTAQNAGPNAMLQAEAQRRGIPVQALGLLAQIGIPIAGLGSQSTGQSQGTQQASGAQQFAQIMGGIGSLGNLWGRSK